MEVYYWFVVHPRITFEDAEYVYGKSWREYLFYHNDIQYPLLGLYSLLQQLARMEQFILRVMMAIYMQ